MFFTFLKKISVTIALFVIGISHGQDSNNKVDNNKTKPLLNADLLQDAYSNSAVGKSVKIRVFYESKSILPTTSPLVYLLDEGDKLMSRNKLGRQIWLTSLNNDFSSMKEGNKYIVEGILVEDEGFYGALVIYARSINKIRE